MTSTNKPFSTSLTLKVVFALLISTSLLTGCKEDDDEVSPKERIPFLGTYDVLDKNSDEDFKYRFNLTIDVSSKGVNKVDLINFRYLNLPVHATIKGNKMFISQVMGDDDEKVEITGEGTLTGSVLEYNYKIVLTEKGVGVTTFENSAIATKLE